jgi:PAS domain S-box-containing protein
MARVLVVDDNEANRELLVTLLGYHGHSVTAAADGRQALDAARRERPDLVITDLVMPVMDGYELIREIRADEALATVPAIFCTANYLENEARPISAALGVRHLVAKPIDPQVMLRAIADALTDGAPIVAVPTDQFQREHQRAVSAKLADTVGELEHIEAALRASEARFRSVAEHSPIGIFSLDAAGSVTYANPLLLEICGSPPAASEIRWAELAHPDDREQLATGLAGLLTDGAPHGQRLRLVVGAGQLRWVHLQVAPVLDDSADVTFVGTVEDITAAVGSV